jgi:drug/metabolite transporter (DMT)-like permease
VSRRGVVLFLAMGIIWGIPYLLIKVAVREVDPVALVFARTAIGAILLVPVAVARGNLRPLLPRWRPLLAYTVVEVAVPWVLLSRAEESLSSSLSGLLIAAVPLVGAAVAFLSGNRDSLGRRGFTGLAVGLAGVAVLLGFDVSAGDAGAAALVGVVVAGYALGPAIVARSFHDVSSLGVVALSLLLCTVGYAPFALRNVPTHVTARVLVAVVVLGVVCTALAFVLFFALIAEVGPVRATVITYLNPAVAVVLGVVFLHERFSTATGVGFVLILAGSYLAAGRPGRTARSEPDDGYLSRS